MKKHVLKKIVWWIIAIAVIGGIVVVPILQLVATL